MPTEIHIKHPLKSNGSSQLSRLVKALSPTHFRLDERASQDLINAAYEYARILRYYSPDSPALDNWTGFWEIENLTYMAILAAMDTDQIRKDYEKIDLEFGQALEGLTGKKSNHEIEGQYFRRLLRFTRDTARRLERHYQTLREDIALKSELLRLIRRDNDKRYDPDDIESSLQQLIAWHKAWDDGLRPEAYRAFLHDDHRWGVRNRDEYDCILPDESMTDRDQIRGLFLVFFNSLVAIKARAQQLFDAESARLELPEEKDPRPLAPHIALFITFLNLFRHAQDSLNEIPERHLDFYYDEVLCLQRRPESPDHAYLIFTLAKEFNDELIEQGTTLLAGKDKNGQPIKFKTLEQWKVTKAQVTEVKGLYWHDADSKKVINVLPSSALKYLNHVEDTNNKATSWRGFADDSNLPFAKTGFAVASPQLILREGKRIVEFDVKMSSFDLLESELQLEDFELQITTAKGWTTLEHDEALYGESPEDKRERTTKKGAFDLLPITEMPVEAGPEPATYSIIGLRLLLVLEKDFEAIDKIQLDTGISTKWPALKVFFPPSWGERAIRFEEIAIEVDVRDIQENLIIQTDQGIFDGTKTIFPFGPSPEIGNRFFVGSTEIFQKSLTSLGVNFGWIAPPGSFFWHYNRYAGRPQPKLKIDFIDSAEAIGSGLNYSSQNSRHEYLGNFRFGTSGRTVRFKVLDIDGGVIPPTEVQSVSIGSEVSEYDSRTDEHVVTISTFNNPNFSINSRTKNYSYFGNFGWLDSAPRSFDRIEVYLIPDRVVLEKTVEANPMDYFFRLNLPRGVSIDESKLRIFINEIEKSEVDYIAASERFRVSHDRPPIAGNIRIEYDSHDTIVIPNLLGLTQFEANLRPDDWAPEQIELQDTVDAGETGKLTVVNAFREAEPLKEVKVLIGGQVFTTNANGEIDLGPVFAAGVGLQVSHFQYENAPLIIPADYDRHNLLIKLNPLPVLYEMQAQATDYFLDQLSRITIEATIEGLEKQIFEKTGSDAVVLKLPQNMVERTLNLRVIQDAGNFKTYDLTMETLLASRSNAFQNESLSVFSVRLESAGDNSFDLLSEDSKIISNFENIAIAAQMLHRDPRTQHFTQYSPTLKRGFIRFTLQNTDFFHKQYPKLLGIQANAGQINEPYTPSINALSLSYKSRQEIVQPQDGEDGFFHLSPFEGYKEVLLKKTPETPTFHLLPFFSTDPNANNSNLNIGNLFIGLDQFKAGDNLSLLIQLEEGSEQNFDLLPPKIEWFYLAKNEWKPLDAEKILKDTTAQMTRSGLLQLAIPSDATKNNTILNAQYHWISAKVVEGPGESVGAFAAIKSIRAQVVEAVFAAEKNSDLKRLEKPLDASTISKLELSRSAVKKVEQPFASFSGRKPETDNSEFHRRVSERLRHKDRALTAWDYEHLLLEQYDSVAIAKCIPHTRYETSGEYSVPSELAPGFISLAVVPDFLRRPNMVREEPRFSRGDLYEMRDFLLPKANLFLQPIPATDSSDEEDHFLQVVNPQYEQVYIGLRVWLRRGADQNLAKYQINEALRIYLAPWLYDAVNGPTFGREIRRSKLVQLIENLDDVDVIQELKIYQSVSEKFPTDSLPLTGGWEDFEVSGTVIRPQTARSILTTVLQHQIVIVTDNDGGTVAPRKVSGPPPTLIEEKNVAPEPPVAEAKTVRNAPAKVATKPKPSTSKNK